jgi:hypothetical protein
MPDIRIVPGNAIMSFTSSLNFIERITQDPSGSLTLYGSGSVGRTDLFSIDGNNGRLFSVSDDLSDSLFSVNTIAGLPVIEAFANNSVNIGQYTAPPIKVTGSVAIITGSLNGGADFSRTALVYNESTNTTRYPVFSTGYNGAPSTLYADPTDLTYNPSSNTLTAGTFSGALSGNASTATTATSASMASLVAIATQDTTSNTYNVTFTGGTSGNHSLNVDATTLTYNPSTGIFATNRISATSVTASLQGTASYATNALTASTAVSTPNAFTLGGSPFVGYVPYANANLTFTNSGIYYSSTNIGVGTTSIQGKFHVYQSTNLGTVSGNSLILRTLTNTGGVGGNLVHIKDYAVRDATGSDWTTWRHHNSIDIDGSHNTPGTNTKTFWERDPLAGVHYFGNSATTTLTVDATNNSVGIGAGPETGVALIATVSNNAFGSTAVLNNTSTGTSALAQLQFRTANQTSTPFVIHQFNNGAVVQLTNVANASVAIGTNNTTRLTITNGGAMGLGITSPTNTAGRFEASNDIVAYSSSDKNWKKNIKNINSPLEKLSQINGVEFDWIEDEPVHGNKGHDVGVIAQEIEQILPEAVQTRESGMKAVKYEKVIPLLIEAIKDQQKQIEQLKQIVNGFTK